MTFVVTRIDVGDYEAWKPMFDQDSPKARERARSYRVLRGVDDPGVVVIEVEFASSDDAREGRRRLLDSGVLDRFDQVAGPTIVTQADSATLSPRA